MPPKKKNSKGQPTLVQFVINQINETDPVVIEQKIQKETQRLMKIRKELQQKQREEERVIKNILRLQINEDSVRQSQFIVQPEEQYWIMTTEHPQVANISTLKLVLQDYGEVISNPQHQLPHKQTVLQQETSLQVNQWKEKGSLNSTFLEEYTPDFIHSLRQYQYVADNQ